jgi:hypothetical protein
MKAKFKTILPAPPTEDDGEIDNALETEEQETEELPKKARAKTGRTKPFSTKVTPEYQDKMRWAIFKTKLKKVEILEESMELFLAHKGITDK